MATGADAGLAPHFANETIWGLVDDRAGHTTQTMGLVTRLNATYAIKRIRYNALAALPNLFNLSGMAHVASRSRGELRGPFPKMVIACGRRMAPILRAIKRASPETVTIYMMWPDSLKGIDLAIVPAHDNPPQSEKVIVTRAPLTAITPEGLEAARRTMQTRFAHLPKPMVAVCIGGSIAGMKFTLDDWRTMLAHARKLAGDGSLLITTSRRTGMEVEEMLQQEVKGACYLHLYDANAYNPYTSFLACADALCVSGDSLSMSVEATVTGKPVFIYTPESAKDTALGAHKHIAQHQILFDKNLARPLDHRARLKWQPDKHVNDAHMVVRAIYRRFPHVFTGSSHVDYNAERDDALLAT